GLRGLRGDAAVDALQALVETVMPVDDARRAESIIVVELVIASRTRPVFRAMSERMGADLSAVMRDALDALDLPDPGLAAAQLVAVVGGLTMDAVTPHGGLSVDRLREVLRAHLRLLLTTADGGQ
ncbi:TetR family transcriptional regulator C-terminal domain-containing protein, partial [Brevibacterium epidermidis]|uniref:TetR family transcriptional regulator C-terminal domain-containing protein n=1 Tax=Brevibacterium epidermidis TaxID=1698 RepID=UPI0018E43F12